MIKIYPDGKMTQYLKTLVAGSTLLVSAPIMTENMDGCPGLVMIAGGSAVTVAIQVCEEVLRHEKKDVHVELMMCNSTVEDILYQDIFDTMLKKYPAFRLAHCISSLCETGNAPPKYKDANERVVWYSRLTNKVKQTVIPQHDVIRIEHPNTMCMVSGPMGLCKASLSIWEALGQPKERLHILDELPPDLGEGDEIAKDDGAVTAVCADPIVICGIGNQDVVLLELPKPVSEEKEPTKMQAVIQKAAKPIPSSSWWSCCKPIGDEDDAESVSAIRMVG